MTSSGCRSCPDDNVLAPLRSAAIAIFVVCCTALWYNFSWRPMLSASDGENVYQMSSKFESLQSAMEWAAGAVQYLSHHSQYLLPYLKLYITFFQVLSSFITFNVVWPSALLNIMIWLKGTLFLDIMSLPGLSCLWHGVSFQNRLMTYTLAPLAVIFILLIPVIVNALIVKFVSQSFEQRRERVVSAAWRNIMFWLFLIYPVVSLSTLEAFNCQPIGLERLAADFKEPCPGQSHLLRVWSYVFIAIYPVGIPVFCYFSMLKMGVHLVAQDIQFTMLLKALVMKYASLNLSSESQETNKLLADCAEEIKITKAQALEILVKFEALELDAIERQNKLSQGLENKLDPDKREQKNSCISHSCFSAPFNPELGWDKSSESIRRQLQIESNKNPRILPVRLLKLAKKLARENAFSNSSITWRKYRDSGASNSKILPRPNQESDHYPNNLNRLNDASVDLELLYAIHPDLVDNQEWSGWIKFQNSIGNLLTTMPEAWKTFNGRKELGGKALDRIGFVFAAYKVDCWFWEMLEMFRK